MQGAAMNDGIVPDGDVIANGSGCALECAVNAGSVLYVYFVSDANKVHVTSHHGIKPNTAIVTHHYIADYSGIGSNETIFTELWLFAIDWKNDWHFKQLIINN
jgi:hypothetical protein